MDKNVYAPELNLFVSIKDGTSNCIMALSNGIDWELVNNNFGGLRGIVWAGELEGFVITTLKSPAYITSTNGKDWTSAVYDNQTYTGSDTSITYSPELNLFFSAGRIGVSKASADNFIWYSVLSHTTSGKIAKSIAWSSELNMVVVVYINEDASSRTGAALR